MKVKITTSENIKYFGCAKNDIVEVDIEDYITCVVASEIGNAPLEACKAQAIAARTFAINRGVLSGKVITDTASTAQAYRANRINYAVCARAARETMGQVLQYNGKLISAVYCDSNGGQTKSSKEQWGTDLPYLVSKKDSWTTSTKNGHGVGMSQNGAINAAKQGKTYKEILNFYYPNTKIIVLKQAIFAHLRTLIITLLNQVDCKSQHEV